MTQIMMTGMNMKTRNGQGIELKKKPVRVRAVITESLSRSVSWVADLATRAAA